MEGKTSGAQDSLLHMSQAKHAREAISNLRLVCVGGTQVRPTLTQKSRDDFLQMFDSFNHDQRMQEEVRNFISLLVFPCGHLVCPECVDHKATTCIVCDKEFNVDVFQRLQPGFILEWMHNIEEEKKNRTPNDGGVRDGDVADPNVDFGRNGGRILAAMLNSGRARAN